MFKSVNYGRLSFRLCSICFLLTSECVKLRGLIRRTFFSSILLEKQLASLSFFLSIFHKSSILMGGVCFPLLQKCLDRYQRVGVRLMWV